MRAYMGDNPYDTALNDCCGIYQIGGYVANSDLHAWKDKSEYPEIKDFKTRGCGVFISTLLPSQWRVYRELLRHHTLVSRCGPYKNKGPDASHEGRHKGVYLCVFKFGKESK